LREAEAHVERLFAQAHVGFEWIHCVPGASGDCEAPRGPWDVSVRIVDKLIAPPVTGRAPCGGCAVPLSGWTGSGFAYVYGDRVREVARSTEVPLSVALGTIVSHEIGHLLLPGGHAGSGLMQAQLSLHDWRLAERGALGLTRGQCALLSAAREAEARVK